MKITPRLRNSTPVGAVVSFSASDMVLLGEILSYSRNALEGKVLKMAEQLAAMCDAVDSDAQSGFGETTAANYDKIRKLFDPFYRRDE